MLKLKTTTQNLKLFSFLIVLFTFTFLLLFFTTPVHASNHCASLRGQVVPGKPAHHTYNGVACSNPAQFNQNVRCLATTGNRYIVTFCTADGCEEEYPEEGPNAPDLCKRPDPANQSDIGKVFGQILPPQAIQYLGFGSTGISKFLSNLVALIYSLAIIVLIFMILWGAFDWLTSEGDKEKLESAKRKLVNAFIGIMLFAVAFAIIQILGTFTGFKFFEGQK